MSVNLRYISSTTGETFYFQASNPVKTKTANFHNYAWTPRAFYFEYGAEVQGFGKSPLTYNMEMWLSGAKSARVQWLDKFHSACDLDITNMTPGRLYWEDMYIECFIISTSTYPAEGNMRTVNDISVFAPYPSWIYERTFSNSHTESEVIWLLVELDSFDAAQTPFDYISGYGNFHAPFEALPSDFRVVLIGDSQESDPAYATIKTELYNVMTSVAVDSITEISFPNLYLQTGECLVVDSRVNHKTARVYDLKTVSGHTVIDSENFENVYSERAAEAHIFKKMKFGAMPNANHSLIEIADCYSVFGNSLIVTGYFERSEPTWISS